MQVLIEQGQSKCSTFELLWNDLFEKGEDGKTNLVHLHKDEVDTLQTQLTKYKNNASTEIITMALKRVN